MSRYDEFRAQSSFIFAACALTVFVHRALGAERLCPSERNDRSISTRVSRLPPEFDSERCHPAGNSIAVPSSSKQASVVGASREARSKQTRVRGQVDSPLSRRTASLFGVDQRKDPSRHFVHDGVRN